MTPHANSTPVDARPWQDSDVQWFGSSQRIVAGRPDTRYGWLETDSGPCIVKALDLELATYSSTLLAHERAVLRRLRERGAPVPELMASPDGQDRPDWLVTRFAGLSAEMLDGAQLATDEGLAAWAALLQSAVAFDRADALPVDLWAANLVLPLTHVVSGQLVLSRVVLIDHAHTAVAGINLRRPLLMARMARVAPELREALRLDQEAMARTFREAGVPSPTMAATGVEARAASQRLWAEYDRPQELQRLLDSGRLRIDAAIQFAVGHALTGLAAALPAPSATALLAVVKRLTAAEPQARFADLPSAASAVRSVITDVPRVGHVVFPRVTPSFMAAAVSGAKPAKQRDTAFAGHTAIVGADDRMAAQRQPAETALEPALPQVVGRSAPAVSNAPWTEVAGQDAVPSAATAPAADHGADRRGAPSQPTPPVPTSAEVVAVDAPSQPISGSRTPQPRRSRRWAVAAVALLAIGSAPAWRALQPGTPADVGPVPARTAALSDAATAPAVMPSRSASAAAAVRRVAPSAALRLELLVAGAASPIDASTPVALADGSRFRLRMVSAETAEITVHAVDPQGRVGAKPLWHGMVRAGQGAQTPMLRLAGEPGMETLRVQRRALADGRLTERRVQVMHQAAAP